MKMRKHDSNFIKSSQGHAGIISCVFWIWDFALPAHILIMLFWSRVFLELVGKSNAVGWDRLPTRHTLCQGEKTQENIQKYSFLQFFIAFLQLVLQLVIAFYSFLQLFRHTLFIVRSQPPELCQTDRGPDRQEKPFRPHMDTRSLPHFSGTQRSPLQRGHSRTPRAFIQIILCWTLRYN